jgi:hypothetical protein
MIFKDNSYMEYAKYIQAKGIDVHTFNSFEEAIEKIPACNPGAIVSINYKCNTLEDFLIKIREVTGCKIYILSGTKPPAKLIQKADELKNIAIKWRKEIDIDIENIPETEEKVYQDKDPVEELPDPEADDEEPDEEQTDKPEEIVQPNEEPDEDFSETNSGIKLIALMEKSLEEDLKKFSSMFNIKTAEHMEEVLQEIEKDAAAAVIFSGSICEKNFEDVKRAAKSIPKIVKLYAIDNVKLNQLIYGELETNGIKFFPDFQGIIDDMEDREELLDPEADEESTDTKSDVKPGQNIIKNVSGAVSEIIKTTKNIPKPVINFPNIKVPKLKPEKKEPKEKEVKKTKNNKQVHTFVERSKVMIFLSPLTTGKTEIASNVAQGLSLKGVKTALIDLDLDKKGLFYSFPIFEKGDIYKYRLLSLSLSEQKLVDEPLELSFKANKNLFVYTTHRDIEIPFTPRILDLFIRYLKRTVDVIVVDVGKNLSKDLTENLLDIESIDKYLVANQDIGVLNTIPYSLKWLGSFPAYYKDWNLVLNNYRPLKGLKDSEILSYFYDEDSTDLKFDILKTFHIPQSNSVWEKKTERALSYGSDESFDAAIDKIIENWMIGKAQKGGVTIEI